MTRPGETGAIARIGGSGVRVALVFPNVYRVGMANLGFQLLYRYFNAQREFSPERFFLPDPARPGRWGLGTPRSEESGRPLNDFPLIAFSIPFENDYPAVPGMLLAAGIPPLERDRGPTDPVVIAGGVSVSMNPEVLAPFLDLCFIGELEDVVESAGTTFFSVLAELLSGSRGGVGDRREFQRCFRDLESVYVPSAYRLEYGRDGLVREIVPESGFSPRVKAAKRRSREAPVPISVLFSPDAEFGDSLLVEMNRGCGRGCRFCAAAWTHFPVRYAKYARFKKHVDIAVAKGRTIGLIGSDVAGHPELERVLTDVVRRGGRFSLSSIRPEGLTPRIITLLEKTGQKTATLAPEVASTRLKKLIGKEIPSQRFYELVEQLVSGGIPNIRFYFMIGLPTETEEDVETLVDFVLESRRVFVEASRAVGRIGTIGVQVNPFVPKPWTPFQWAPMFRVKELEKRLRIIKDGLRKASNVTVRVESGRQAVFQGLVSRGDRRIEQILLKSARQEGRWSAALGDSSAELELYVHRERSPDEIFPWDVTEHGIRKETLWKSYSAAMSPLSDSQ